MQLTGLEILRIMNKINPEMGKSDIIITPFNKDCLGSNSYDLHLDKKLRIYASTLPDGMFPYIEYKEGKKYTMRDWFRSERAYSNYLVYPEQYDIRNPKYVINPFDSKKATLDFEIPENGAILSPSIGYLGATVEYTETRNLFPYIDGKSSIGRNFILTHHTAGRGDDGFCGTWTLEINSVYPTLVCAGMQIGQIYYEEFRGKRMPYDKNPSSHYNNQKNPTTAAAIKIEESVQASR